MKQSRARLVEGAILPMILKMSVPMFFSMVGMMAFNLMDTYFVGRLGTDDLAAMSFTFPVVMIIASVAMGLGTGASSVISRAIGQADQHRVRRLTTDALVLSSLIVAIFVAIGLLTIDPLFRLMGARERSLELVRDYMIIWYLGVPFLIIPMVGNNAIRATGDTLTPSIIMAVALIVNLIFDPLLIFGIGPFPRMELTGAAIATVLSRSVTLLVSLSVLHFRDRLLTIHAGSWHEIYRSWKLILSIGLPAAGTNLIMPLAMAVITALVAKFGDDPVAALGVASRIDMFAMTPLMALGSVLSPFVGQNYGAGKYNRISYVIKRAIVFSFVFSATAYVTYLIFGYSIAELFTESESVVIIVVRFLRIVSLSTGFAGIVMMASLTFNSLHLPYHATALTVFRLLVLLIPLAILGSYFFGLNGIFFAVMIANVLAGVAALFALRRESSILMKELKSSIKPV